MMNAFRRLAAVMAGFLLAGALAVPAAAAPKQPAGSGPAYVDFTRVLNEYRKTQAFAKYGLKIRDQAKALSEEMEFLAGLRYCSETERKEALAIKAKGNGASSKEKARLEELSKRSDAIDNEAATLSQKQKPTQEESARIQELSKMRTEAMKTLAKEENDRRDQMRKVESEMLEEVENELLKLVEKVAKDQKLDVLYERRAVLFGGTDLTDEVVKKLPK